ncbi:MlaA family lipoprotein [Zooshikella harenae]|uniref:VacJ family lipoprotein n=1 Tax=Zooshikella harenae TaxID=2827238 RepID=A0ABS5ZEG5_9GAMM|nr:VacJ family lipoprotein [Zooshikella harenae]MBU2712461.1 VacJ family lipoprotein [Zooshikella harenae]
MLMVLRKTAFSLLLSMCVIGQSFAEHPDDPWEGFNRSVFQFNETVDENFFKPVAKGYRYVTPDPVEQLVTNFFGNIGEVPNIINDLLQLEGKQAANDTGRLLVNSTVGMLGMLDVAEHIGLEKNYEDFGLTMGHWQVPRGPYLVLPLLGPSTARSATGMVPDSYMNPIRYVDNVPTRNALYVMKVVDKRAGLLKSEDLILGDKYTFIRDTYIQNREFLLTGEQPEDDF